MGYKPRHFEPDVLQFITCCTLEQTLLLVPTPEITNAIGAAIAHYQRRYSIDIFDFVVLSNHFHLVACAPRENLSDFMRSVLSAIAFAVNRFRGRRGHLWERRFQASPILGEGAQVERAVYIYSHGCKEGLVDRPEQWPGVASIKDRLSGTATEYEFIDYSAMARAAYRTGQSQDPADFSTKVSVKLSPWPFLEGLSHEQAQEKIRELLERALEEAAAVRDGKPSLGVARVLAQDPRARPHRSKRRSPRPLCHASTNEERAAYAAYRRQYAEFVAAYRQASQRFRDGDALATFPAHSYRPPLPRHWSPKLDSRAVPN